MSISTAVTDIKTALTNLSWVDVVHEVERDPGGVYSVYLIPDGCINTRELVGATTRAYLLKMRLIIGGKDATASAAFEKMAALETAVESVSTLSGGNQIRPLTDGEWAAIDPPSVGYMAFETTITLTIRS